MPLTSALAENSARERLPYTIPPPLKYREIIKLLEANGWRFDRMGRGDHMIYRHPSRTGAVVVAGGGKLNRDIPKGTENAIRRQAGLK